MAHLKNHINVEDDVVYFARKYRRSRLRAKRYRSESANKDIVQRNITE